MFCRRFRWHIGDSEYAGAWAQDDPMAMPDVFYSIGRPKDLSTLETALPYISWSGKEHGVLLAIGPEKVGWTRPQDDRALENEAEPLDDAVAQPLFAPKAQYRLSASFVARYFSRKLIYVGTVTVLRRPRSCC